jgi:hypothetical protein
MEYRVSSIGKTEARRHGRFASMEFGVLSIGIGKEAGRQVENRRLKGW